MTIRVCHKKFTEISEKIEHGVYLIALGFWYGLQLVLPVIGVYSIVIMTQGQSIEDRILVIPLIVFGIMGGLLANTFALIVGDHFVQKINQRFKLFEWREDC